MRKAQRKRESRPPKRKLPPKRAQLVVGQSDRVSELEDTAPERWEYVVYRNGKRVKVSKEEYESKYHPGSEDQL